MKKFAFTMQSVLDVRQTVREAREMELAAARAKLAEERAALEAIDGKIAFALEPERLKDACEGSFFVQRERYLKMLRDSRKRQERKVNEAIFNADSALSRLKDAIVEVKKMEKSSERQRAAWELEFKRDEQKINDETASARAHMRVLAGSFE